MVMSLGKNLATLYIVEIDFGNTMSNLSVKRRLGDYMRARLPKALAEFFMFGLKMAWACLFAGLMLGALLPPSCYGPKRRRWRGMIFWWFTRSAFRWRC